MGEDHPRYRVRRCHNPHGAHPLQDRQDPIVAGIAIEAIGTSKATHHIITAPSTDDVGEVSADDAIVPVCARCCHGQCRASEEPHHDRRQDDCQVCPALHFVPLASFPLLSWARGRASLLLRRTPFFVRAETSHPNVDAPHPACLSISGIYALRLEMPPPAVYCKGHGLP